MSTYLPVIVTILALMVAFISGYQWGAIRTRQILIQSQDQLLLHLTKLENLQRRVTERQGDVEHMIRTLGAMLDHVEGTDEIGRNLVASLRRTRDQGVAP